MERTKNGVNLILRLRRDTASSKNPRLGSGETTCLCNGRTTSRHEPSPVPTLRHPRLQKSLVPLSVPPPPPPPLVSYFPALGFPETGFPPTPFLQDSEDTRRFS